MKIACDKVLTIDNFDETYSSWKGRSLTIMGDQIKVSMDRLKPRYFDTIYLFEQAGIMIGFTYGDMLPECFISTIDGLESEPFVDASPHLFVDMGRTYIQVKKQYRNVDLRKHVIGLNLIEIPSLDFLYAKFTWPLWETIEDIHNGAVIIKKAENNYAISTLDTFPACYIVGNATSIIKDEDEENVYHVQKSTLSKEITKMDITKKLAKIKLK